MCLGNITVHPILPAGDLNFSAPATEANAFSAQPTGRYVNAVTVRNRFCQTLMFFVRLEMSVKAFRLRCYVTIGGSQQDKYCMHIAQQAFVFLLHCHLNHVGISVNKAQRNKNETNSWVITEH